MLNVPNYQHKFAINVTNLRSWRKLNEWIRLYHAGTVTRMPRHDPTRRELKLVLCSKLFDIVMQLVDVPWKTVEQTLETVRDSFYIQKRDEVFKNDV